MPKKIFYWLLACVSKTCTYSDDGKLPKHVLAINKKNCT